MANDKVSLWGDLLKFGRSPASGELLVGDGSGFTLTNSNVTWGDPIEFSVPIKVDGQVWSTTTGFKFPDGTVQATAASSYSPPTVSNNTIISNVSGSTASPAANTLTQVLDSTASNTQGSILYRGASNWSALGPGTSGQILVSGGPSANPAWASGSTWTLIKKTADQSLTTNSFTDDTELQFAVDANATYSIRGVYSIYNPAGGVQLAANGPTATRFRLASASYQYAVVAYNTTVTPFYTSGSYFQYGFFVTLAVGNTGGTFAMRIAQNSSNASATVFEKGSWIEYIRQA